MSTPWTLFDRRPAPRSAEPHSPLLNEKSHKELFNALDSVREWFSRDHDTLICIGRLVLGDAGPSARHLAAGLQFAEYLRADPPITSFAPLAPDTSAETLWPDDAETPWFSRPTETRKSLIRIRLSSVLLDLYDQFVEEGANGTQGSHYFARKNILIFMFARIMAHELGHVAIAIFRQKPRIRSIEAGTGRELESCMGGECAMHYADELQAANITGCQVHTKPGVVRFIGLEHATFLCQLASVDWYDAFNEFAVLPREAHAVSFGNDKVFRGAETEDVVVENMRRWTRCIGRFFDSTTVKARPRDRRVTFSLRTTMSRPAPPLPDEIISLIISPVLKISDESFMNLSPDSPFATFAQSTSALLVVCKAWLRVATPLLYGVVVIRSKAQAAALQVALKSNPELGQLIKKLRVEGGFGAPMRHVLRAAPNVQDLLLFMALWSDDSALGICDGLDSIDPSRLILHDTHGVGPNKNNMQLSRKIASCLTSWNNLKTLILPYAIGNNPPRPSDERFSLILKGISAAGALEEITVKPPFNSQDDENIKFLEALAEAPCLKHINVQDWMTLYYASLMDLIQAHEKLRDMVVVTQPSWWNPQRSKHPNPPRTDPNFVPLASASRAVQDAIWDRVLYFAVAEKVDQLVATDIYRPDNELRSRRAQVEDFDPDEDYSPCSFTDWLLISKQFQSLAIPHLYRNVPLFMPGSVKRLLHALQHRPELASHIRTLMVFPEAISDDPISLTIFDSDDESNDSYPPARAEDLQQFASLLALLTNLTHVIGNEAAFVVYPPDGAHDTPRISWECFAAVSAASGATLRHFGTYQLIPPAQIQNPKILQSFRALRSLEWSSDTEFLETTDADWRANTFASLECLCIVKYHPSFLSLLASAKLPSLRRVYFLLQTPRHASALAARRQFLAQHHSKLTELRLHVHDVDSSNVLDECPDLQWLMYGDDEVNSFGQSPRARGRALPDTVFKPSTPHSKLTEIHLDLPACYDGKEATAGISQMLASITPESLPALREVRLWRLAWPITERDIKKTALIPRVEALLKENPNVVVKDADGAQWRPRLKKK
uniref:F-box domain-containing protein n=1 Tax=Mycena chlorophos TaxID=658473 RepID=A0ABQ0LXN2_MYCCL|nr:predicted protein [Mycena chlorophos]